MYELYIANKNYSSWSLRPWVLMREAGIEFEEHLIPFGGPAWRGFPRALAERQDTLSHRRLDRWCGIRSPSPSISPSGMTGVWPQEAEARAWARSAAAEMHSGFTELRNRCSMSCGVRLRLKETPAALERDIARLETLWSDGLARFGGPFLAASSFTAVDAFFAPVAYRVQTYGLQLKAARRRPTCSACSRFRPCVSGTRRRSPRTSATRRTRPRCSRWRPSSRICAPPAP